MESFDRFDSKPSDLPGKQQDNAGVKLDLGRAGISNPFLAGTVKEQ
jgi:hypothetical protein